MYTTEDFLEARTTDTKYHIAMHLIRAYERDVHMVYTEDMPVELLLIMQYAQTVNEQNFLEDVDTERKGFMVGMYEGFLFLITGTMMGQIPEYVTLNYGTMMLAHARPLYGTVQWEDV